MVLLLFITKKEDYICWCVYVAILLMHIIGFYCTLVWWFNLCGVWCVVCGVCFLRVFPPGVVRAIRARFSVQFKGMAVMMIFLERI